MHLCVVTLESIDINKNVVMKLVNPLVLNAPFTLLKTSENLIVF